MNRVVRVDEPQIVILYVTTFVSRGILVDNTPLMSVCRRHLASAEAEFTASSCMLVGYLPRFMLTAMVIQSVPGV